MDPAMNDLAKALYDQGNFEGARHLEEQILESHHHVLGNDHPLTLAAMENLAHTLYALEDLSGVQQLEEQILESRRRVLGEEHPDTLAAKRSLALTVRGETDMLLGVFNLLADASQAIP